MPSTPFEAVVADYFEFRGSKYLAIGDRLTGWTEAYSVKKGVEGARGLIAMLRLSFATFGVPVELSSDGGPEFGAKETRDFLRRWGVKHRMSSAYFAQSNGRAELAVKTMKRLLEDNVVRVDL